MCDTTPPAVAQPGNEQLAKPPHEANIAEAGSPTTEDGRRIAAAISLEGHTLRVQDTSGSPITGAKATSDNATTTIGISNAEGILQLTRTPPEAREIQIRADGYWPAVIDSQRVLEQSVVTLRSRPGHALSILVVTDTGTPASDIDIRLTQTDPESDGAPRRARTDTAGRATIPGLTNGTYQPTLHMGDIDVTGFLTATDPSIHIPCEETKWTLRMPRVAWAKPVTGRIVTGYYRAPIGGADFGKTHGYLRAIEKHLHGDHATSLAQAFMSPIEEVTFVGLLDPGGWMVLQTPVAPLAKDLAPAPIENVGLDPIEYGQLTVTASTIDGKPIHDAPFALNMTSAGKYGSFTLPISFQETQKLPVGKYVFVALQAGAANLFDGPKHAITIAAGGEESVQLRATREIRKVQVAATLTTKEGETLPEAGIVRISDGNAFHAEVRPATADTIWLPTGLSLHAKTRSRNGLYYIDLTCDFFVPPTGAPNLTLNLNEQP